MSVQAQAGSVQAWSVRGGTQLLAVLAISAALLAGLVGFAIVSRPSSAVTASTANWSVTHPVMADRGADSFAGYPSISAADWSATHPVMADRGTASIRSATGFDFNASRAVRGGGTSAGTLDQPKGLLDRGANR